MCEMYIDCEEKCLFFHHIPTDDKNINRAARQATKRSQEFPGSLNTLCGSCVKSKIIASDLEEKIKELLGSR